MVQIQHTLTLPLFIIKVIGINTCSTRAVRPAMIKRETQNAGHPPQQFLHKSVKHAYLLQTGEQSRAEQSRAE